jgi:hypothetical protein
MNERYRAFEGRPQPVGITFARKTATAGPCPCDSQGGSLPSCPFLGFPGVSRVGEDYLRYSEDG